MERFAFLLNILDEEISIYRNLLNIISSEYESFTARDYDSIHNHITLKENFYKKIVDLEAQREKAIEELRTEMPDTRIETLSDLIDNVKIQTIKESLTIRRTTLRLLIDRIAEANDRNRIFLDKSRELFADIMDNIKKLASTARSNVYGNKGKLDGQKDNPNPLLLNKEA